MVQWLKFKYVKLSRYFPVLLPGILSAQFIFSGGNTGVRVEKVAPKIGGSLKILLPRASIWYKNSDSVKYYASSIITGGGIYFTSWFYAGFVVPYHMDEIRKKTGNIISRGPGDIFINIKLIKKLDTSFYLGFMPFMTFPLGDLRVENPDSATPGENFKGGLFRDFTSNSYDYGLFIILSKKWRKAELHLNMGGWNGYQYPFAGAEPNLYMGSFALSYKVDVLSPFVEFFYSKFTTDTFGRAPVFITLGSMMKIGRFPSITFSMDIPLFHRGTVNVVKPGNSNKYYGFISPFPNFTPSYSVNLSLDVSEIVMKESALSRVKILTIDAQTGSSIDKVSCKLDDHYRQTERGIADFGLLEPGVYELKIQKDGYCPVKKFIKVGRNKDIRIEVKLKRNFFTLLLKVRDQERNPVQAKVFFPGLHGKSFETNETGMLTLNLNRDSTYSAYIWAPDFKGDNIFIKGDHTHDTLAVEVLLNRKEETEFFFPVIYFDFNSYKVKREYLPLLDQVGKYLLTHPDLIIEIDGHASPEGPDEYNYILSKKRAEAVKEYLIERYGIKKERIIIKGFGKDVPAVPNISPEKRAINRRAEFRVIGRSEK